MTQTRKRGHTQMRKDTQDSRQVLVADTTSASEDPDMEYPIKRQHNRKNSLKVSESAKNATIDTEGISGNIDAVSTLDISSVQQVKEKLSILNKRLEYYIFVQRGRDATTESLQQEQNTVRTNARKDQEDQRTLHESQIHNMQESQENIIQEMIKYKDLANKMTREYDIIKPNYEHAIEMIDDQKEDQNKQTQLLTSEQQKVLKLEDHLESALENVKNTQQTVDNLQEELKIQRNDIHNEREKRVLAEMKLENINTDHNLVVQSLEEECEFYRKENEVQNKQRGEIESELRVEFTTQQKDILEQRQQQWEQEKDTLANDLKNAFDERIESYIQDIHILEEAKVNIDNEKASLVVDLQRLRMEKVDLESNNDKLKKEVDKYCQQLTSITQEYENETQKLGSLWHLAEKRYAEKTKEFDEQMDVKVRLAMEIKKYREQMDDEELRLGSLSSYFEKGITEDATEGIRLISMDPNASSIMFKNGYTEYVNLQNWKLYSKKNRKEFEFPDINIEPGQSFIVYIGENAKQLASKSKNLSFAITDVFASSNDTALLLDPFGRITARADFN